jgi:protease YdgD
MAALLCALPIGSRALTPPSAPATDRLVTPVAVFGSDDRAELPSGMSHLKNAIGTLSSERAQTICTAFCVGEAMVATAAHCLYRTADEVPPRLGDYRFTLPARRDRPASRIAGADRGSAPQNIAAGSLRLSVRPPIDATSDWALVRLAEPVCRGAALNVRPTTPEAVKAEAAAGRLSQVSFHRDFGEWRLGLGRNCTVQHDFEGAPWPTIASDFTRPDHLILHTCDTGGASSGSPLLVQREGAFEVVAINVGTYVQTRVTVENGQITHRGRAENVANTAVAASAFAHLVDLFAGADVLQSGPEMLRLQERLRALGHYDGKSDAGYGIILRSAIQAFERTEGRTVTGIANRALLERLNGMAIDTAASETRAPARPPFDTASRQSLGRGTGGTR